jgi:phosphopantetheinyl transferase
MNSQADNRWQSEHAPLIGRLYEVESLRETEGSEGRGGCRPEEGVSEGRSDENRTTPQPAAEAVLPFVGHIADYVSGLSITVERTLTLDEDLHLADHTFVHAPGVKPVSACLPVVPLTMAMEIMAETAACLAPGLGLIGFEDVKASRWIELTDTDRLPLRIKAETAHFDNERHLYRIAAGIYAGEQSEPAIKSCVLFAPHYYLELYPDFSESPDVRPHSRSGGQIYEERHMFHGPTYQLITGEILLHDCGIIGESLVRDHANLFRSTNLPQLLIDPALLDTVGQLFGIWAIEQRERQIFPIGMKKLELYRSTPPAGTRVPLRIEVTQEEAKTLRADVEIQDGDGSVWLRIKDWGAWKFRWPKRVTNFRRLPTRAPLSRQTKLPGLAPTAVCCMIAPSDLTGFDATLLARFCLNADEMRAFGEKKAFPKRQQQWLLGRIAAKDAARIWLARTAEKDEMLHPAALAIETDQGGQPQLALGASKRALPKLSIAHCDEGAVALACSEAVGVDIEPICPRQPSFLETIATDAEQRLLNANTSGWTDPERVTRLWCAKEAVGKLLGIGMNGSPRTYELCAVNPDGMMQVVYRDSSQVIAVRTLREHELIIAYAGAHLAASDQTQA